MKVRIGDADLQYDVQGTGPALLLLHAFPLGMEMWDDTAASLAGVARVIRFDYRGFGGSSLKLQGSYNPAQFQMVTDGGSGTLVKYLGPS